MARFPMLYGGNWGPSEFAFNDGFRSRLHEYLDGELFDPSSFHQRFHLEPGRLGGAVAEPLQNQPGETGVRTGGKFAIKVDIRHFSPEEITVKAKDKSVIVHCKHEEKSDDRGCYVQREVNWRYDLPEDVDPQSVICQLTPMGYLALEAPRKNPPPKVDKSERIPIEVCHESSGSGDKK
ncbi:heat shock protein Hsp-12.2 [Rhipicephalus sanguineus]|uniref:SHSP domain-containing protein n=1 Tax=Rhipicephalus sanguineus TaxID=34632 RepID=A0A9D4PD92_RHISA|nr:heat shock protein Hsp-12.2 [Rhipicephalus sanguineus]KAH7936041.1 hypothetical protein HPB52_017130 [Rhipicephalus sanguineus]